MTAEILWCSLNRLNKTTNMIFCFCFQVLNTHVASVEKQPLTTTGSPLHIKCKHFLTVTFVISKERDCHDIYVTLIKLSSPGNGSWMNNCREINYLSYGHSSIAILTIQVLFYSQTGRPWLLQFSWHQRCCISSQWLEFLWHSKRVSETGSSEQRVESHLSQYQLRGRYIHLMGPLEFFQTMELLLLCNNNWI